MNTDADKLAKLLKVLSVETRVRIIQLLKGRALCVNALACRLDVTQGAVSQHLRVLRDTGLVIDEKRGYYVHYHLNEKALAKWQEAIQNVFDVNLETHTEQKGTELCAAAIKTKKDAKSRKTSKISPRTARRSRSANAMAK